MSRQFRAIAIVVALAAIAVEVMAHHRQPPRSVVGGPATVLVATRPIQEGTSGDVIRSTGGFYTTVDSATAQIPVGAIGNPSALAGKWRRPSVRVLSAAGGNVALDATTAERGKLIYLMQNKNARLVLRTRK